MSPAQTKTADYNLGHQEEMSPEPSLSVCNYWKPWRIRQGGKPAFIFFLLFLQFQRERSGLGLSVGLSVYSSYIEIQWGMHTQTAPEILADLS